MTDERMMFLAESETYLSFFVIELLFASLNNMD